MLQKIIFDECFNISSSGPNPLLDNPVNLRLQIFDTDKNFFIEYETQNLCTSAATVILMRRMTFRLLHDWLRMKTKR